MVIDKSVNLRMREIVGEDCITSEDGDKVYELVWKELEAGNKVVLDFEGVDICATPFLNAAIGQLVKDFNPERLKSCLQFSHLPVDFQMVLERVVENAVRFYSDAKYKAAIAEVFSKLAEHEQ